jgi:hypothetical protein
MVEDRWGNNQMHWLVHLGLYLAVGSNMDIQVNIRQQKAAHLVQVLEILVIQVFEESIVEVPTSLLVVKELGLLKLLEAFQWLDWKEVLLDRARVVCSYQSDYSGWYTLR